MKITVKDLKPALKFLALHIFCLNFEKNRFKEFFKLNSSSLSNPPWIEIYVGINNTKIAKVVRGKNTWIGCLMPE